MKHNTTLPELPLDAYKKHSKLFDAQVYKVLSPEAIVARRDNIGATSPKRVKAALKSCVESQLIQEEA